jgi:hypothetical protein
MNARTCTLALVMGLAIPAAYAGDPMYKSTMPDGRIVYGESPQPGAKRIDKVAAPPEVTGVVVADDAAKAAASRIVPPPGPGVAVIPDKVRPPTKAAVQALQQNVSDKLPARSY